MRPHRLLKRLPRNRSKGGARVQGNFDRVTGGMASGWLHCSQCTTTSYIRLDARNWTTPLIVRQEFPRLDVPGEVGFWARFPSPLDAGEVTARCVVHLAAHISGVTTTREPLQGVGEITNLTPYTASGWFHSGACLCADTVLFLDIDGSARMPVTAAHRSSASAPVDWSADFGDGLGYSISHGTRVELIHPCSPAPIDSQTSNGSPYQVPVGEPCNLPSLARAPAEGRSDTTSWARQKSRDVLKALVRCHGSTEGDIFADEALDIEALVRMLDLYAGEEATLTLPLDEAELDLLNESFAWDAGGDDHECANFLVTRLQRAFASVLNLSKDGGPEQYEELLRQFVYWTRHVDGHASFLLPGQVSWLTDRMGGAGATTSHPFVPLGPPSDQNHVQGRAPQEDILRILHETRAPGSRRRDDVDTPASPTEAGKFQVCVAGLVGHPSGIGLNATQSVSALAPVASHLCTYNLHPGGKTARSRDLATAGEPHGHGVVLHLPMDKVAETYLFQPRLWNGRGVAGLFLWETEVVPDRLQPALDLVDEVWTASTFVAAAFTRACGRQVSVVGHAVTVDHTSTLTRDGLGLDKRDFVVHFAFDAHSTAARKNPVACVRAFTRAFPNDPTAKLVVKVRNWSHLVSMARSGCRASRAFLREASADSRVIILTDEWSRDDTLALIGLSDCYLSLHRSEGFGYTIAEAMALGVPVVVTGYSGNMDFCSERTARLVNHELIPVETGEYFYDSIGRWADPTLSEAVEHLREVRAEGPYGTRTTEARRLIESDWSVRQLTTRYVAGLRALDRHGRT